MKTAREKLGYPFIPFTFPTAAVSAAMDAGGSPDSDYSTVDALNSAYLEGIDAGVIPYAQTAYHRAPMTSFLKSKGFNPMTVANFLNALVSVGAASYGGPAALTEGQGVKEVVNVAKTAVKDVARLPGKVAEVASRGVAGIVSGLDPLTKTVKYVAIVAVAGVLFYGLYQFGVLKKIKRRVFA